MLLHHDRYSPSTFLRKNGVVVHDSESGDGSSATLVAVLQTKGDRPSPTRPGQYYGAGYHAVTDGKGGYVLMADATAGPYSAPPLNASFWHICMPGYAKQTREEWQDALSLNHIKGVARFIVDKWEEDMHSWFLGFMFADQLHRGLHGYTSHAQVSLAWHQTDHTDPGPNFPWDVLEQQINSLTKPVPPSEEDDDMPKSLFIAVEGTTSQYVWTPGSTPVPMVSLDQRDKLLTALGLMGDDGTPKPGTTVSAAQFAELH